MVKRRKKVILGLDIATTTGFSLINDSGELVGYGKVSLKPKEDYQHRYKDFRKQLRRILTDHKPSVVVLEAVYVPPMFGKSGKRKGNPKTVAYLNSLRGIAIESIPLSAECKSVTVKEARKGAVQSGSVDKQGVFDWAVSQYSLDGLLFKKDNDITDSIALSFWGYCQLTKKSN